MAIKAKHIQSAKTEAIAQTKALLQGYSDFIFADYRGLTVAQITALRKQLREKQSAVKIVKNNFAKLAFEEMKVSSVADFLTGPTAVVLSKEDTNEVAKILYGFAEEAPVLQVKGGVVANEVYDAAKLKAFSALPGKKQLIAMIASTINAPVQKLAATLQAYADKKSKEGSAQAS
ncbi:MAG: 50S ribosomal protein L10 [Treponemataceae bacterium]|nr:MAG: 50S ribosomal protein L10 [Treponemataceae bacterium]